MPRASVSEAPGGQGCRALAAEILLRVEKGAAYADILLDQALRKNPLSSSDRALLTQIVYGTLRWRGRIDWHLSQLLPRPLSTMDPYLRSLLRLTLYQPLFLDKVPDYAAVNEGVELAKAYGGESAAGLVNGVARSVLRKKEKLRYPDPREHLLLYLSVLWSHPEWLVERWLADFGREEAEALLKANNAEPPLALRANSLKGNRESLLSLFRARGLDAVPSPWSPQGIESRSAGAIERLPGFNEGLFQVQGEASQLVAHLLDPQPGERILDACAAPGGKTTHIAELMEDRGEIVATDISPRGLEKIEQNVQRLGLKSIRPTLADVGEGLQGPLARPYDRILIDAPCSALGTLRSHPEAKWQKREQDIQRLSRLQKKIVNRLCAYLKPGGVLVYSTCTLTREENEKVIENFLGSQRDFILEEADSYLPPQARSLTQGKYFLALPHRHNTDGFFAARMKRAAQ